MKIKNEKGIALVFSLLFVVVLFIFQGAIVLNAVHQTRMAEAERQQARTFYTANGGAQIALEQLDVLINTHLQTTTSNASPSGVISFTQSKVNQGDGMGWLTYAVRDNNVPQLTLDGEQALYSANGALDGTSYSYTIIFTEKSDPVAAGTDAWDLPYNFQIISTATENTVISRVNIYGDFTVRVQRENLAKFALFTNRQQTPGGTNVWFTDRTNFAGPLHTNDRYNFALNPGPTFEENVVQDEQTARFYNGGWPVLLDADANGTSDVPTFNGGFTRGADEVAFNSVTQENDMVYQAKGGNQNYPQDGIYVPTQGGNLKGGIYVKGNATVNMSVDGQDRAIYSVTQGSSSRVITVDHVNGQTSVLDPSDGSVSTYSGNPKGADGAGTLIFVDGNISGLGGTVQKDTEVTVASHSDMIINNDLVYADHTSGSGNPGDSGYTPPSAVGKTNMLGLVSWGGDVRISTSAPDDVNVHGTVMAQNGIFTVDNYTDTGTGSRGTATVLGGVITDDYGAFGLFNGSTGQHISGYGRNFVYDQRMQQGYAPPYFPTLDKFISFTNDITDKLVWREGD